jgi:hypothetical protein
MHADRQTRMPWSLLICLQGMNFVVGVLILGRIPFEVTGGVHLPSAVYVRNPVITSSPSDSPRNRSRTGSMNTASNNNSRSNSVSNIDEGGAGGAAIIDQLIVDTSNPQQTTGSNNNVSPASPPLEIDEWLEAEYEIFIVLDLIIQREGKLGMGGLWQSHAPIMKLRVYQLDRILHWMLPRLHSHFINIQMTPEVIVAQWFITMFSYTVPLQWTMQIWGYIFYEGWPALFRVVLSLLQILEDTILDVDLEGVSGFISVLCYDDHSCYVCNMSMCSWE